MRPQLGPIAISEEIPHSTSAEPQEWKPTRQERLIMLSYSVVSMIVALDATILTTVLPTLAEALNGNSVLAFWAGASYVLASAVLQPVVASLSASFGRQMLTLMCLGFFIIGTLLCGLSHGFAMFLAGRVVQGLGGGGIVCLTQVIFCDIVPLRQRPRYFSSVLGTWALGTIVGPVIGGALAQHYWRWIFWINLPICGIGLVLVIACVRLRPVEKLSIREKLRRTDWLGMVLLLGGMTSFLIGVSWGGSEFHWTSVQTLAPILAGLAALGVFAGWEIWRKNHTLLPISLFYCWSAFAAFYCALCVGTTMFVAVYYYPFYNMAVHLTSPLRAGVELIPSAVFLVPGAICVSLLTARFGRFRWALWSGWGITILGSALMLLFDRDTSVAIRATITAIIGLGTGMVFSSVNFAIQAISKPEDSAMAATMYAFLRALGYAVAIPLGGTVFQNAMKARLLDLHLPSKIADHSEGFISHLRTLRPNDPLRIAAVDAYVHGFRAVWWTLLGVSISGAVMAAGIGRFSMDKELHSHYTSRRHDVAPMSQPNRPASSDPVSPVEAMGHPRQGVPNPETAEV